MSRWRRGAVVAASAALAACFSPSPPSGLPCTADRECPSPLRCDVSLAPPLCVDYPGGRPDATPSVDAPPPIACDEADPAPQCPDDQPICDDGACRGCVADAECSSGACLELEGTCPPEDTVLFSTPGGAGSACTRASPCSLNTALPLLGGDRHVIALRPGNYTPTTMELGDTDATYYLSGPDRGFDEVSLTPETTSVRIRGDARLVLEGMTLPDSGFDAINLGTGTLIAERIWIVAPAESGIDATGATVTLRDVVIEDVGSQGVIAGASTVTIDRSVIVGSADAAIYAEDTTLTLTSSILAHNGLGMAGNAAVTLVNAGGSVIAATTITNNSVASGPGAITCDRSSPMVITSSIIAFNSGLQVGDGCMVSASLFTSDAPAGNMVGDPQFVAPDLLDFHIKLTSPARGLGALVPGVDTDIDGQIRPQGAPDAGADEIP